MCDTAPIRLFVVARLFFSSPWRLGGRELNRGLSFLWFSARRDLFFGWGKNKCIQETPLLFFCDGGGEGTFCYVWLSYCTFCKNVLLLYVLFLFCFCVCFAACFFFFLSTIFSTRDLTKKKIKYREEKNNRYVLLILFDLEGNRYWVEHSMCLRLLIYYSNLTRVFNAKSTSRARHEKRYHKRVIFGGCYIERYVA